MANQSPCLHPSALMESGICFHSCTSPILVVSPKIGCRLKRIYLALLPPLSFIASGMDLAVVNGAKRHGELVADLSARPRGCA